MTWLAPSKPVMASLAFFLFFLFPVLLGHLFRCARHCWRAQATATTTPAPPPMAAAADSDAQPPAGRRAVMVSTACQTQATNLFNLPSEELDRLAGACVRVRSRARACA